jgi:hypothetical protein
MRLPVRSFAFLFVLSVALSAPAGAAGSVHPSASDLNGDPVTATYMGQPIEPTEASHHFCHTRDYPVVRCFDTQAEVDADLGWIEPRAPGDPGPASGAAGSQASLNGMSPDFVGAYTIAYWDINYGGTALTIFGAVPNFGVLGWNDNVSSIKSVNCGIPRYYVDASYGGLYWQNGCNYWSPNLYEYNDTFSAVVNEAP